MPHRMVRLNTNTNLVVLASLQTFCEVVYVVSIICWTHMIPAQAKLVYQTMRIIDTQK